MEIFLTADCSSLSGFINRKLGYFIARRDGRFFSQRSNKMQVPPDGHWSFIVTCAQLAQNKTCIADIKVAGWDIKLALLEARLGELNFVKGSKMYNAAEVLELKKRMNL